jgi:hypothetical protein
MKFANLNPKFANLNPKSANLNSKSVNLNPKSAFHKFKQPIVEEFASPKGKYPRHLWRGQGSLDF